MRILFFGTSEFALPTLALLSRQRDFALVGVVTQPDRPRGRGRKLAPTPVKRQAEPSVPVFTPERLEPTVVSELLALRPDILVVVAYGQKIPRPLFETPPFGAINLHPSALPLYRGAAPVQWTLYDGHERTAITTIRLSSQMDAGDILLEQAVSIHPLESSGELLNRLSELGAELVLQTLEGIRHHRISPRPQESSKATLAPKITKELSWIDFNRSALQVHNQIRALTPVPGARTRFRDVGVQLSRSFPCFEPSVTPLAPGAVAETGKALRIQCARGSVQVERVKVESRREVSAEEFASAFKVQEGERFG